MGAREGKGGGAKSLYLHLRPVLAPGARLLEGGGGLEDGEIVERPPHVVRAIKQLANAHRRAAVQAMRDAERDAFAATWTAPEHWALAQEFLDRRRPEAPGAST